MPNQSVAGSMCKPDGGHPRRNTCAIKRANRAADEEIDFRIAGLLSAGCADTLMALLCAEAGVYAVDASLERAEARVPYDAGLTDPNRLIALIETPGYRVTGSGP